MCHAVAAAAPAVHCNGIQPYKGAAWEEGRLLLLSSGGVINYLALWVHSTSARFQSDAIPFWHVQLQMAYWELVSSARL